MKLQDYRDTFYLFSGKLSDICRQLSFAGIAMIWLFKRDVAGQLAIPTELVKPSVAIVLALAADLAQYLFGSIVWRLKYTSEEKAGKTEDEQLEHPAWLELFVYAPFIAKVALVVLAYWWILSFLVRVLPS